MSVKIRFQFQILLICAITFSTESVPAQKINKYGLKIINRTAELNAVAKTDSNKKMVSLLDRIPDALLDLRYATSNNFMHKRLYPAQAGAYMRLAAARALQHVQKDLQAQGLGIKIFDAYRPYSITEKMWELVKDDRYAADPKKGSGHNRGIAVDLTIVKKDGTELPMGTGFDNFTDTAHHTFKQLPAPVLNNRNLLRKVMEKYGFNALETEWWHYSLPNPQNYDLIDVDFKKLKYSR